MLISQLINKTILVWGYEIEGKSIVNLLLKNNIKNKILVATKEIVNEKIDNVEFILESDILKYSFDLIIKSSGISYYRNEIKILEKKGIIITTIFNIFFAEIQAYRKLTRNKFPKTIGITGTKGKSTTVMMCAHMLKALGHKVAVAGNIGSSVLDLIGKFNEFDYIIIEMSSYQCKNLKYNLSCSILLNLFPEHVDWHLTHENYYNDKMNILKCNRKAIVNYNNQEIIKRLNEEKEYLFFNTVSGFHVHNGKIYDLNKEIYDTSLLGNIQGNHIFENLCSLLTLFKDEKLNVFDAIDSLTTFETLEHRLEIFYNDKETNTIFVNDSIATIPEATLQAINTFKKNNIFLILGGFNREQDYSNLIKEIKNNSNIKKIFLLGQTGKIIFNELKEEYYKGDFEYFNTLQEIVDKIQTFDLKNTTVLLSPASPSYDMFKNFEERGELFKKYMLLD